MVRYGMVWNGMAWNSIAYIVNEYSIHVVVIYDKRLNFGMLTFKENIKAYFSVEDKNQFQGLVASNNLYSH